MGNLWKDPCPREISPGCVCWVSYFPSPNQLGFVWMEAWTFELYKQCYSSDDSPGFCCEEKSWCYSKHPSFNIDDKMTWFTHAFWVHLSGSASALLPFHFAPFSSWEYLLDISVTSKRWDVISQCLRPLHFKSYFSFYSTFIKMAQENELVKRFFHLFHRNNIQHQCCVAR